MPVVIGGIEASLRRIAHYDYWQDKVRRSILVDSKADLLLYGNAERAIIEIAHRLARREPIERITDVRGTAFIRRAGDAVGAGLVRDRLHRGRPPGPHRRAHQPLPDHQRSGAPRWAKAAPRTTGGAGCARAGGRRDADQFDGRAQDRAASPAARAHRDPPAGYEQVKSDPVLYAHANRVLHLETNPGNARALVQRHGDDKSARDVWINPPPIPLSTAEMDHVFDLPYARSPHPSYADEHGSHDGPTKIPAWEMIRFSVNIMRGCFGGCTFCSITEHEGRIIQSRSEDSVIREIEEIRDKVKGFTGVISDLGGPTANMYRIGCKSPEIEAACRKPSCVYPGICPNLNTDHGPLIHMYRRARALRGVKKILIGSGLRYDLAIRSPEYVKELVTHHVGGYLKIAPEHTEGGPLSKMMKPGIGSYDRFKQLFEKFSAEAGKKQYLIPYFIAAHPGTSDEDMMNLALWLKRNGFKADQVQTFYPSPMATATAMYHTNLNPLKGISRSTAPTRVPSAWTSCAARSAAGCTRPSCATTTRTTGRCCARRSRRWAASDLIGNGKHHLIPTFQPATDGSYQSARRKNSTPVAAKASVTAAPAKGRLLTQHTGLPPRETGAAGPPALRRPPMPPKKAR